MISSINISKLTKYYGSKLGISNVSLKINQGEILGFIGPNGAGKSTTIRTMLGLLNKTSGTVEFSGLEFDKNKIKILENIGYLPAEVNYYSKMKAIELLKYSASFYKKDCNERIIELAELLNLDLHQKIDDMSTGNKKKVGIIQAFLHDPKIVILDEPTSGLDPLVQENFFNLLQKEKEKGVTIFFSSHVLNEVQKICDRIAIIKSGQIIDIQSINSLRENSYKNVKLTLKNKKSTINIENAVDLKINENKISFIYKGKPKDLLMSLIQSEIDDIVIDEPNLEDVFLHYYK